MGLAGWTRRFTALVACLSLFGGSLEVTIPDVHDADGGVRLAAVENPGPALLGASQAAPGEHPTGPAHSHHVDQCSHTHADGVPTSGTLCTGSEGSTPLPGFTELPASSLPATPHHPPPIA